MFRQAYLVLLYDTILVTGVVIHKHNQGHTRMLTLTQQCVPARPPTTYLIRSSVVPHTQLRPHRCPLPWLGPLLHRSVGNASVTAPRCQWGL
jgi:hypothetical protein